MAERGTERVLHRAAIELSGRRSRATFDSTHRPGASTASRSGPIGLEVGDDELAARWDRGRADRACRGTPSSASLPFGLAGGRRERQRELARRECRGARDSRCSQSDERRACDELRGQIQPSAIAGRGAGPAVTQIGGGVPGVRTLRPTPRARARDAGRRARARPAQRDTRSPAERTRSRRLRATVIEPRRLDWASRGARVRAVGALRGAGDATLVAGSNAGDAGQPAVAGGAQAQGLSRSAAFALRAPAVRARVATAPGGVEDLGIDAQREQIAGDAVRPGARPRSSPSGSTGLAPVPVATDHQALAGAGQGDVEQSYGLRPGGSAAEAHRRAKKPGRGERRAGGARRRS